MPLEKGLWNVVVVGAWNVAILTPDGIRERLFKLSTNDALEIQVALDRPGRFRVVHGGVSVVPTASALEAIASAPDAVGMQRASEVCATALSELPRTPVSAAGLNFRFSDTEPLSSVLEAAKSGFDDLLSDAGYEIAETSLKRSLRLAPGVVNVTLSMPSEASTAQLDFNFHLSSQEPEELKAWLARASEFSEVAERMSKVLLGRAHGEDR